MRFFIALIVCLLPLLAQAEIRVEAIKVTAGPKIDGDNGDPVWAQAKPVLVNDLVGHETILLSALYTEERIFFLVMYPDKVENTLHQPWLWNEEQGMYGEGDYREDTFVFKWNMLDKDVNLSNFSEDDYRADVWYWKANRSNLAGYADDKMHILSSIASQVKPGQEEEGSAELQSLKAKTRYLRRLPDAGDPPYQKVPRPQAKTTQVVNRYASTHPSGSRADVEARGSWAGGYWVIEFSRKLQTGHADDLQLSPAQSPLFGVSIFSLYGHKLDTSTPNRYGMGRISEPLRLYFVK
jgi:hypothetical protein